MAVDAVCFQRMNSGRTDPPTDVLPTSNWFEMVRVDAVPNAAEVIEFQSPWNHPAQQLVCKAMCKYGVTLGISGAGCPVTTTSLRPDIQPTCFRLVDLTPKPFRNFHPTVGLDASIARHFAATLANVKDRCAHRARAGRIIEEPPLSPHKGADDSSTTSPDRSDSLRVDSSRDARHVDQCSFFAVHQHGNLPWRGTVVTVCPKRRRWRRRGVMGAPGGQPPASGRTATASPSRLRPSACAPRRRRSIRRSAHRRCRGAPS